MRIMRVALLLVTPLFAFAQTPSDSPVDRNRERIIKSIRKEILRLPFYGTFDWLTFQLDGSTVTLNGATPRPTIKTDSERVVKKIEGVEKVVNNVEVLPVGSLDDQIRLRTYQAIMGHTAMTRYAIRGPNSPIHIIVKNGNVTLEGFVGLEQDKNIAGIQANGVSGVFSVKNNLRVDEAVAKQKKVRDKA
jgi:hyperosmotically inducible periplasmic protein